MFRAFGLVLLCVNLVSLITSAETLKLEEDMVGEEKPGNKVWAQIELKNGVKTCGEWRHYCPQGGCKSCVVKYLVDEEREARKLTWSEKDKLWLDRNGKPYDTAQENMKQLAEDLGKRMSQVANNNNAEEAPKKLKGRPLTMCEKAAEEKWGIRPGIWVVDTQGNFYTSVEQSPGRFHHSSFMAGGLVRAAGQVVFVNGRITHINNSSGHYKPDQRSLKHVLKDLHLDSQDVVEYDLSSSARKSITNMRESKPTRAPSLHSSMADAKKAPQEEAEEEDSDTYHVYRPSDCYHLYDVSQGDYRLDMSKE